MEDDPKFLFTVQNIIDIKKNSDPMPLERHNKNQTVQCLFRNKDPPHGPYATRKTGEKESSV